MAGRVGREWVYNGAWLRNVAPASGGRIIAGCESLRPVPVWAHAFKRTERQNRLALAPRELLSLFLTVLCFKVRMHRVCVTGYRPLFFHSRFSCVCAWISLFSSLRDISLVRPSVSLLTSPLSLSRRHSPPPPCTRRPPPPPALRLRVCDCVSCVVLALQPVHTVHPGWGIQYNTDN